MMGYKVISTLEGQLRHSVIVQETENGDVKIMVHDGLTHLVRLSLDDAQLFRNSIDQVLWKMRQLKIAEGK